MTILPKLVVLIKPLVQILELSSLSSKRVNSSVSLQGAATIRPIGKYSRMVLGEVKAREREIVRKGIDRLELQIKQYTSVYVSKDQVDIALIKKCKTTGIQASNSAMENIQKTLQRYVRLMEWTLTTVTGLKS